MKTAYKNTFILKYAYNKIPIGVNIQDDYKLCKRLYKFIGKKVMAKQKLNAHHSKEK